MAIYEVVVLAVVALAFGLLVSLGVAAVAAVAAVLFVCLRVARDWVVSGWSWVRRQP